MDCVNEWPINEPINNGDLITLEGSIHLSKVLNTSIKQNHNKRIHSHSDLISENNLNERNRYDGLSIENGMQLLQFKRGMRLRPKQNHENICDGAEFSDNYEEPYSPEVSEYVPSICKQRRTSFESADSIDQNQPEFLKAVTRPGTSSSDSAINVENCVKENRRPQQEKNLANKKRKYPKKTEPRRKRTRRDKTLERRKNFTNKQGKFIKKKEIRLGCKQDCIRKCHNKLMKEADYQENSYERKIRSPSSPERQYCSSTTQPHTDSGMGHIEGEMKEEDSPRRLCLVCGDVASGFHYGVASCEACKAFFKRTIQGNIEYTCPASGECEINKRRRKACQACRFRKCLRSGMLKEGVRLDRVRGGRQKYRRNPDSPYQVQVVSAQRPMLLLEDIKMLEVLAACEPDCLDINTTLDDSKHRTLSILSELYDRELVGIIGWAKQIPGFTDLMLNDQMRLLQSTWAEILTLTLAFRSMPLMGLSRLKFATDFTLDEKQSRDCGAIELYQTCCHVVQRLDSLSILKEEYYLLKALVLTNSDVRLDEYQSLKKFRDTILAALSDAIGILRPTGVLNQIQQLLLCMPALRQADQIVRRFWSDVHQQDLVPMNKLFLEMLEAYCR